MTTLLLRNKIIWIYKNRYLYLNCPEVGFWLRQPDIGHAKILYLTAKFASKPERFAPEINSQVQNVQRLNVLPIATQQATIVSYTELPPDIIHDPRWKLHVQNLYSARNRGGGFWFWKPLLIHKHLQELQDGDFLIYSDSDMLDFFSWLPLLLETMMEWKANYAQYQMPYLEQEWTKRDVYETLCPNRNMEMDKSRQYAGGHVIVRKDEATMALIQDWLDAVANYHWVNDEPSTVPNLQAFREHRHDQSLLSLLLKCKYMEQGKRVFPWTCLQTWALTTFQIQAVQDQ